MRVYYTAFRTINFVVAINGYMSLSCKPSSGLDKFGARTSTQL